MQGLSARKIEHRSRIYGT